MTVSIFVDTTILLYARDASEPEKQPLAAAWLEALWDRQCGRLSFQVLEECYTRLARKTAPAMDRHEARRYVASFLAWRDWGSPDPGIANVFAQAALRAADGAFVLGVMRADTANAGRVYFPSGTPEPADLVSGRLDLAGSLMRELAEETGLTAADVLPAADWTAVDDGPRLALMRVVSVREPAEVLAARILDHVARDDHPELAGIHVARSPADIVPAMPPFVAAFLHHVWSGGGS